VPQIILIVAAALAQYIQAKMLMAKQVFHPKKDGQPDFSQIMSKQMLYMGPILTLFIGIKFPAGLSLYWLASTLFMIFQQQQIIKKEKVYPKAK
jgi:YidC/Oxa1 family membrane protein insertase